MNIITHVRAGTYALPPSYTISLPLAFGAALPYIEEKFPNKYQVRLLPEGDFIPMHHPCARSYRHILTPVILSLLFITLMASTQETLAQGMKLSPNDTLTSVRIGADRSVTFSVFAPHATEIRLGGTDVPEAARAGAWKKDTTGVWTMTTPPLEPGAYRYVFMIDGVSTIDPKNPSTSESNMNTWSLVHVPGAAFMDVQDVPHGTVSVVTYYSKTLGCFRRMHVYTPPGYESGTGVYPVFYLLHGAFDCDASWSSVGRAGVILDNLIAEKKAVPMVVVMPAGHTGSFPDFSAVPQTDRSRDPFVDDFLTEIKPYTESHYRISADRAHRAIAGLSMGGAQTLNIAIPHLEDYSAIGVFSSGIFELRNFSNAQKTMPSWEARNASVLDNAGLKKGLNCVWVATGKEDFLLAISRASVDLLKKHGFDVQYQETSGAHTWDNWRKYLCDFAPLLFRSR